MTIAEALKRHRDHLMALPGVTGVGIGERAGRPVLLLLLDRPVSEVRSGLPETLEGFSVALQEVGEVTAL